jgi:hypothetical protein
VVGGLFEDRGGGEKEASMEKIGDLESQLRKWREERARKQSTRQVVANDRRTVRVNGREVVVVTKPKRSASLS